MCDAMCDDVKEAHTDIIDNSGTCTHIMQSHHVVSCHQACLLMAIIFCIKNHGELGRLKVSWCFVPWIMELEAIKGEERIKLSLDYIGQ